MMSRKMLWIFLILVFSSIFTACGSSTDKTADDVTSAFLNAGLSVEDIRELPKDKSGDAPTFCDVTQFDILPAGMGNIFVCRTQREVDAWVKYWDNLSDGGTKFDIYVFPKDNVVVTINGVFDESLARQYEKAIP